MDLPETTLWWTTTHHHQQQNTSEPPLQQHYHQPTTTWFNNNFNLNNQNNNNEEIDEEEVENHNHHDDDENNNSNTTNTNLEDEKEPMFEKPLTPSDVGKLNRLVIPKQHAEKYFPLGGQGVSNECKGLLLSFEDESGKCWRFRYSYWNSSQSYVLTKGWSRYVKDKRLDAGDVVLFERHRLETQRLFINWRRRRSNGTESAHVSRDVRNGDNRYGKNEVGGGVGVGWTREFYPAHPYPAHQFFPYQQDSLHAGRGSQQQEGERQRTKPVEKKSSSSSSSSSRVLRLFGVNMECQPEHHDNNNDSGPSTPQCSSYCDSNNNNNIIPSTQGITDTHHLYHYHQQPSPNSHPHLLRHQPYYY